MMIFKFKQLIISALIILSSLVGFAQKTAIYDQPGDYYQSALALFNKQQFGPSQDLFQKSINLIEDPYSIMRINAEYYKALCAVELFNDDAELLLIQFIEAHPESMHIKHVYFQLGKFQYRKKGYKRALRSFERVDVYDLQDEEQLEFYFKRGYAYFKTDSVQKAKKSFFEVIDKESKYQPPALYYYSHIAYDEGNYETALKGFVKLKDDPTFRPVIPYYITHIYYMQQNYDELLEIAPKLLESSTPKRQPEIARLIGEAYYRTNQYKEAIPYLERYYETGGRNISAANQYQMAYAYYKVGKHEKAAPYFQAVSHTDDEMAQSANYHLAICYIALDKKNYALNAFQYAYQNNKNPEITADALYNFAKLSYELDYNPYNQALKAFEKYVVEYPDSEHRKEAMTYLTQMYLSTNNYAEALKSIEKIQNKSPELLLAYQRILYSRGTQFFNQGDFKSAIGFYDRSLEVKKSKSYTAKALFWKAESHYRLKDYQSCIAAFNTFLTSPGAFVEANYNDAYYTKAYASFQLQRYAEANKDFRIFILNIKDKNSILANDAYNRIGDSYYIQEEYKLAIENYDAAIKIGKRDIDYALYKKAEAHGPLREHKEKAAAFEKLVKKYPKSTYAGNAEYALAKTYNQNLREYGKAKKHYLNIIDNYPAQTAFVKRAKLDLGYLYNNIGEPQKAIAVFKRVYEDYKGSRESEDALRTLQVIYAEKGNVNEFFAWSKSRGVEISLSVQDSANYYVAKSAYMDGNCEGAVAAFGHYIERFPTGYFTTKAHFYKAECEHKLLKYIDALKDYQYLVDHPAPEYTEKSVKHISYINYDVLKDYPAAREAFVRLKEVSESKEDHRRATINIMRCDWFTESYDSVLLSAQEVLQLENLTVDVKMEAQLYQARVYLRRKNWVAAEPILVDLSKDQGSEASSEALYNLAEITYQKELYDSAEALAYMVIQEEPSFEIWVVKSFILSADVFVKTGNLHQAKATLESIVNHYEGDEELLEQARKRLVLVDELIKKPKEKVASSEMIIDLGDDAELFIEDEEMGFEEELEDEEY